MTTTPGDHISSACKHGIMHRQGHAVFVELSSLTVAGFRKGRLESYQEDARALPAKFNARGDGHRSFAEAVSDSTREQTHPGWPVEGPRTTSGLAGGYLLAGRAPREHHHLWMQQGNVPHEDCSRFEHEEVLMSALEVAMTHEQLKVPSLASMEIFSRRVQRIEEEHRLNPDAPTHHGYHHFMGASAGDQGSMVTPALSQHEAAKFFQEAQIAKERMK